MFGEKISAKRTTLMLCADSALARQFDAAVWAQQAGGGAAAADESDSDEDDTGVVFIEQNAYCFKKIVHQLRLVGMTPPGEPIPPPVIAEHEQKSFDKMVNFYFPGNEAFIKTEGALRPLGSLQSRLAGGRAFVFQSVDNRDHGKFDAIGVIHHIATEGGTSEWVNPHTAGRLVCEWSSTSGGESGHLVSKYDAMPGVSRTGNQPNSWMRVDLGEARTLVVNHYALKESGDSSVTLRNWQLQGADAAEGPWTMLRRHDNDASIQTSKAYFVAAWPVDAAQPFRFFRIFQHGHNVAPHVGGHLSCAGIELYGRLTEG